MHGEKAGLGAEVCGTVGCLAFHASQLFPDRLEAVPIKKSASMLKIVNVETHSEGSGAFEDAFGIGTGELCNPVAMVYQSNGWGLRLTPKDVADGIRKFVKEAK